MSEPIFQQLLMPHRNRLRTRFWMAWGISMGIATLIVLTDAGQDYIRESMHDHPMPGIGRLLLWPAIWWYSWTFLAAAIYVLSHRITITKDRWRTAIAIHCVANLLAYILHVTAQLAAMALPAYQTNHASWDEAITHHATTSIFLIVLIYWSVVGASHAFIFYTRYRQREVQTAQLESELHKAQLNALKMQLQPHFLFNTLHAISSLMYRDVESADRMISKLGDLLRSTIEMTGVNEVPLDEEIRFIQNYLEIEQERFRERLSVSISLDETVRDAIVPNLILQPLVENAIKHGIARISKAGRIDITARREQGWLLLSVTDNGPGLIEGDGMPAYGTGLSNTYRRLDTLYTSNYAFNFRPNVPSGLIVELSIPLRHREIDQQNHRINIQP